MASKPWLRTTTAPSVLTTVTPTGTTTEIAFLPSVTNALSSFKSVKGNYHSPTPHSWSTIKVRHPTGVLLSIRGNVTTTRTGPLGNIVSTGSSLSVPTSVRNDAIAKLYDKLRGSTDVSIDAFQWRQLVRLRSLGVELVTGLARPVKATLDAWRFVSRPRTARERALDRDAIVKTMRYISQVHLTYIYGVRPTLNTFNDIARAMKQPPLTGYRKYEGSGGYSTSISQRFQYAYDFGQRVYGTRTFTLMGGHRISCGFNPLRDALSDIARISSINPVSIAYELVPYSFVLDWIVNIGQYLRSVENALLFSRDFVTGYETSLYTWVTEVNVNGAISRPGYLDSYNFSAVQMDRSFTRSLLSAPPFPARPSVKSRLGADQLLAAASLLVNGVKSADSIVVQSSRYSR